MLLILVFLSHFKEVLLLLIQARVVLCSDKIKVCTRELGVTKDVLDQVAGVNCLQYFGSGFKQI